MLCGDAEILSSTGGSLVTSSSDWEESSLPSTATGAQDLDEMRHRYGSYPRKCLRIAVQPSTSLLVSTKNVFCINVLRLGVTPSPFTHCNRRVQPSAIVFILSMNNIHSILQYCCLSCKQYESNSDTKHNKL